MASDDRATEVPKPVAEAVVVVRIANCCQSLPIRWKQYTPPIPLAAPVSPAAITVPSELMASVAPMLEALDAAEGPFNTVLMLQVACEATLPSSLQLKAVKQPNNVC